MSSCSSNRKSFAGENGVNSRLAPLTPPLMRSGFAAAGAGFAATSTADAASVVETPPSNEPRVTGGE